MAGLLEDRMHWPAPTRLRSLAPRALALLLALVLEACASARAPFDPSSNEEESEGEPGFWDAPARVADEPSTERPAGEPVGRSAASPFADLAVLQKEGAGERYFTRYGVNPTVDTRELAAVSLPLVAPGGSFSLTRALLKKGRLPEPEGVRAEDFVSQPRSEQTAAPGPEPIAVSASLQPSVLRRGALSLIVEARAQGLDRSLSQTWNRTVVLADVSGGRDESFARLEEALSGIAAAGGGEAVLLAFGTGALEPPRPRRIADAPPLSPAIAPSFGEALEHARKLEPGAHVLVLVRGALGPRLDPRAARAAAGIAETGGAITAIALDEDTFSEPALEALAKAGRGSARFASTQREVRFALERARAPLVATRAFLEVRFDPARVSRYRLVGHERALVNGREQRGAGGALRAGDVVRAVFELELAEGAGDAGGTLVVARARYLDATGAPREAEAHIEEQGSPEAALTLLHAAFAERLRQSYWARDVEYEDLLARLAALPASVRDQDDARRLRAVLERARELDRRPDPFAGEPPLAEAGLGAVPVLEPVRP